jgi:predicted 3-demethylubiquinone-9 3-methyltransferase (glyoxalase superfamily)
MPGIQRITPCLWFDSEAEAAAQFYASIFPNSRVGVITRYGEAGREFHGKAPGTAMTVAFELDGQTFTALNGGPLFRFSEAVSLQVHCDTQGEIDHYWTRLSEGGDPAAQQCGWLKDRYGLSWQVLPARMAQWMAGDAGRSGRVMNALLAMKKPDLAALERACQG